MEEALGADGHGFLEQHDALIGLVTEELQGGEAAGRRHVEMLPAARGYDKAFCCAHVGDLPCGGMGINVGTMNINVHEPRSSRLDLPAHGFDALVRASVRCYNDESEVEHRVRCRLTLDAPNWAQGLPREVREAICPCVSLPFERTGC